MAKQVKPNYKKLKGKQAKEFVSAARTLIPNSKILAIMLRTKQGREYAKVVFEWAYAMAAY